MIPSALQTIGTASDRFRLRSQRFFETSLQFLMRSSDRLHSIATPPHLLPVVAVPQNPRQPRELAICRGLAYLGLMIFISGAYFVALCTARRVSACFAPVAVSVAVQIGYLFIYALEHYEIIDRDLCDSLIESAENM